MKYTRKHFDWRRGISFKYFALLWTKKDFRYYIHRNSYNICFELGFAYIRIGKQFK